MELNQTWRNVDTEEMMLNQHWFIVDYDESVLIQLSVPAG